MTQRWKRREFLAGCAALCGAGALPASAPRIIDTHIHLFDPTRPQGVPYPAKTDALLYRPVMPAEFVAMTKPFGVTGAVVVEASAWLEDNQWVLDLAKENPAIAGLVGHLEPGAGFAANVARFAKNPLFRGIRLNGNAIVAGIGKAAFVEDLRRLADAGMMLDAIGNAAMISPLGTLLDKVEGLRIAIDHMPNEPGGWQNSREAMRELAKSARVYCKVSGVVKRVEGRVVDDAGAYREALDEVWEMFGPDRVMYGSNWPVSSRVAPYETVFRVIDGYVKAKGGAEQFYRTNSKNCYRWLERG